MSSQHNINNRKDMKYHEISSKDKDKDKHSHSNSYSSTQSSTEIHRRPSVNSSDSDNNLHTTKDIIPSSHVEENYSSSSSSGATSSFSNAFANDGSFMAIFRKKVFEEQMNKESKEIGKGVKRSAETEEKVKEKISPKPGTSFNLPLVGRRKGPKMLKTGVVAKKVQDEEKEDDSNSDAWSKYLAEVRKYKSQKCIEDDGGSTPLVK